MKFRRKIFFTKRLYNTSKTFVGLVGDLPDIFYVLLVMHFRFAKLIMGPGSGPSPFVLVVNSGPFPSLSGLQTEKEGPRSWAPPFGLELRPKRGGAELASRPKRGDTDPGPPAFGHHRNIFKTNFIIFTRNIFHHFETLRRSFSIL